MKVHILWVPGYDSDRDAIVAKLREESTEACLHIDPERKGLMQNWLGAVNCALANDEQSWSVILSDDAYPYLNWQDHLSKATNQSPEPLLGLTHFGGWGKAPLANGHAYAVGPYLVWGGAIAYHRAVLTEIATWGAPVAQRLNYKHDDCLAAAASRRLGRQCAMTTRALFGQPVKKSMLGHNTPIREPSLTIENSAGPPYRRSQATKVVRTGWKHIVELSEEPA